MNRKWKISSVIQKYQTSYCSSDNLTAEEARPNPFWKAVEEVAPHFGIPACCMNPRTSTIPEIKRPITEYKTIPGLSNFMVGNTMMQLQQTEQHTSHVT